MKSDKTKNKPVAKRQSEVESLKSRKKMIADKKPKVSLKSSRFWDNLEDDTRDYRIRGM